MLFQIKFIEKCAWKEAHSTESWGSVPKPNDQILDDERSNTKYFYSNYYQHNWTLS